MRGEAGAGGGVNKRFEVGRPRILSSHISHYVLERK